MVKPAQKRIVEKAATVDGLRSLSASAAYVVDLGFTKIADAGTLPVAGVVVIVQSGSEPGVQAGKAGLSCWVSCIVDVLTM